MWAFAPTSADQSKSPDPDVDDLKGKMSVAPDGKESSEETLISFDDESEEDKQ